VSLRPPIRVTQHRGHVLVTGPDGEPVSLPEVKDALAIDGTADDNLLSSMIAEAREEIETTTGMAMLPQTWRLSLDNWPCAGEPWWDGVRQGALSELRGRPGWLVLPRYPLANVDSVTVYDMAGNASVVNIASTFDVDTLSAPGRLALKAGRTWPIALRDTNAILIEYTAGYANAATVPAAIRRAVKGMVGYLYTHRGDGCEVADAYAKSGARDVMARYAVARL